MFKCLSLTAITFLTLGVSFCSAKIWRVNSNPSIPADFTTLTAAHAGASSGDTLHLEGSAVSYGNLTCSKKLIIIGPGYFLNENPNTQALRLTALVGAIAFNVGSEGSVVMGLDFNGNTVSVFSHDIVIRRNKFSSVAGTIDDYLIGNINLYYISNNSSIPVNNIIISQNYGVIIAVSYASSGILITNNYIATGIYYGEPSNLSCLSLQQNAAAMVQNNVFRRGNVTGYNGNFTNNIMYSGTFTGTEVLVSNNIGNGTQFGTSNGNQANVNMTTVFVGAGSGTSSDGLYKLKAGSPAIGAGYGNTPQNPVDAGVYSGYTPYVLSGLPPIPAIYSFESQPIGSNTDPIKVTIKVKSVGN